MPSCQTWGRSIPAITTVSHEVQPQAVLVGQVLVREAVPCLWMLSPHTWGDCSSRSLQHGGCEVLPG